MSKDARIAEILDALQDIAAGDLERRIPISPAHDELDAVAHAINVVAGELGYATQHLSRARDEAERASEAKTVFLRNMSHELRTPLSAVLGIAQLLQMKSVTDARRNELYQRIVANVRTQVELLDDLLDLSQVESGKLALDMRPLPVRALLDEVIKSLEPPALQKGLSLSFEVAGDGCVLGDRRRVRQILVNVIGNAIKFTERGRIVVRATREGQNIAIDVADTGIGMHPDQMAHLFEPFTQADTSISRRFGGSGLGLALSRRLARQMAGELVIVASAPGEGATFRCLLPEWDTAGAPENQALVREVTEPLQLEDICVLLVEDHADIRIATAALLSSQGATVIEATGGAEAIDVGAREEIDVILMDVRMPGIDGLEAARRLRARGVSIPIVALTADVLAEHRQAYGEAGFTTQFAKPVDIGRLVMMIHGLCTVSAV